MVESFNRDTILAAAKYLDDGAVAWTESRKCITCHTNGTYIRSSHGIKGFPVFLSGGGIKNLRLGESIMLPKDTPLANVWLTLLQQTGVPVEKFSHSSSTVPQILA